VVRATAPIRLLKQPLGIGCAGEIKITPAPEYEKWAIDILVKFRDNEKLQLLTAQRQSGGVSRALTCSNIN
jgi:structural maintenance of chromosomes protein 5